MHSSHIGQAHNLEPAEGHDHHRDSGDPVDRLEGRLVAIAEDGHLGRDPSSAELARRELAAPEPGIEDGIHTDKRDPAIRCLC